MNAPNHLIFDRNRVALHRNRAGAEPELFLLREMLERLADRLNDITRQFPKVLEIGSEGLLKEYLPDSAGVQEITTLGDEEILPFAENHFDLVVACGNLHWVNDLPGMLIQMQRALKPDGLLLAMMPGGETLGELRQSFEAAEMAMTGGVSPRVSPFVDIRDAGGLLQRAGFALPVADNERIELHYDHPLKLMHELRRMGQGNALLASRKSFTPCSLIMAAADYYMEHFVSEGRIVASFDLVTLTGWKPHASQQQPAKRGSGTVNFSILE